MLTLDGLVSCGYVNPGEEIFLMIERPRPMQGTIRYAIPATVLVVAGEDVKVLTASDREVWVYVGELLYRPETTH